MTAAQPHAHVPGHRSEATPALALPHPKFHPHARALPLRVGTRASPLALIQTRMFLETLSDFCPVLRRPLFDNRPVFQEHAITTTGDAVQDRRLADIGGKGLFAKEIHEALADRRIDFAVHSLKDLETALPPGIVLACTLRREDARDALVLGPGCAPPDAADPYAALPAGAVIGTSSVRRQAQLLHARPDLSIITLRGNVQTRLAKLAAGDCAASLLALAGLRRLRLQPAGAVTIDPDIMVPSAGQGIVGVTVRADDGELLELLSAIEDPEAKAVSTAERALLAVLDGSCRTPIGGHATLVAGADGAPPALRLTGLVARADGSFLLKRRVEGAVGDAARLGAELGAWLRADSPADIFA